MSEPTSFEERQDRRQRLLDQVMLAARMVAIAYLAAHLIVVCVPSRSTAGSMG